MQTIFEQTIARINGVLALPAQMIARLRKATEVPFGYQDEMGSHMGIKPILQKIEPFAQPSSSALARLRRAKREQENRLPFP